MGLFIPSEQSERVSIPEAPDLTALLKDYKGREAIAQGEAFDPEPLAIEGRTLRGNLTPGIKYALLPKKTRGATVNLRLVLRYGNLKSLQKQPKQTLIRRWCLLQIMKQNQSQNR